MVGPSIKIRKITLKQQEHVIDRCYVKADETKKYIVNKWICLFLFNFLYLGSWISYDLNDEYDIKAWIKKTDNAIGALIVFWSAPEVDNLAKYLIYMAIPVH